MKYPLHSFPALNFQTEMFISFTFKPHLDDFFLEKKLCELITPVEDRKSQVRAVCEDMNPDILYDIVTISDPFGPTITDESLQCIVLSEETRKGGEAINVKRKEKVCGWCGM